MNLLQKNLFYSKNIRLLFYTIIGLGYMYFMAMNAPLGVKWLPYHSDRVINALEHIINNSEFIKFGITSWGSMQEKMANQIYAVPLHEYLHYLLIRVFVGKEEFIKYGSYFDNLIIIVLSAVATELNLIILKDKNSIPKNLLAFWSFSIFISLPYSYRMNLSMWQDVYCLLFLLFSYILFLKNKKIIGSILFTYSFFWNYHWGILFGGIFLLIRLFAIFDDHSWKEYFPPPFRGGKSSWIIIISAFLSPFVSTFQNILISLSKYQTYNSNVLFRIGIDSASNIHHGGWLAAYQFLGGNRISLCLNNTIPIIESSLKTKLFENIFLFNCLSAISGMFLLSILAIISYYKLAKQNISYRWILVPFSISFLGSCAVLQQSVAAHTQGRSIFFAFIFTIGLLNFFVNLLPFKKNSILLPLISSILIFSFILNNIRVSYLTGPNG